MGKGWEGYGMAWVKGLVSAKSCREVEFEIWIKGMKVFYVKTRQKELKKC